MTTQEAVYNRRWAVLAVMGLCVFIGTMDNTILTVALVHIQAALGASNSQLQWALDAYSVAFAALLFTGGLLGDKYGRKKLLVGGMVFFAAASVLAAYASTPTELIAGRALMGIGISVVPGGTLAVIANTFPAAERAKAIGLWSVSGGLALALGPLLGGIMVDHFWWGSALLINVPLSVVAVVLIAMLVPDSRNPAAGSLDIPGVLLSALGIGLLVYGVIAGGDQGSWVSASVLGPIVGGVVVLALLLVLERRSANPAVDPALFGNRLFSAGSTALAMAMLTAMGASYVLTFYMQSVRGLSPLETGLLMVPVAVGTTVSAATAVKFVGRFGPGPVISAGLALVGVALAYYAVMGAGWTLLAFIVAQLVFGFGMGLVFAPAPAVCMSVVPLAKAGAGAAIPNTTRQVGGAVGIAVIGSVLGEVYRGHIGSALNALPQDLRSDAGGSIGRTLVVASHADDPAALIAAARSAFMSAQGAAMWVGAALSVVAAILAYAWLPGRTAAAAKPAAAAPAPAEPAAQPDVSVS